MEILRREDYPEYEAFVSAHPQGDFLQSTLWQRVKENWQWEGVVSRDPSGRIVGACGVLIQRVPLLGVSLLYIPRGPVCDLHDRAVLADLKAGIDQLAKAHRAYSVKLDPDVRADDAQFLAIMADMGFVRSYGPDGFEGIQARFNHRLPLEGKTQEQLLGELHQKTRYNLRLAQKRGVEMMIRDKSYLDEFMSIYQVTGERDGFSTRPRGYFVKLLDALGDHARLYLGYYQGQPVCGAVTVNYAGKCAYVYGASDNAHRNVMPNYLMQWEMITWAVETGCTVYDFQGVSGDFDNPENPMYGLNRFKAGFGGGVVELAGEFDYHYRPRMARLIAWGIAGSITLRRLRRRLRPGA